MNAERMRELADYIEQGEETTGLVFKMLGLLSIPDKLMVEPDCGTSACLAGHVWWRDFQRGPTDEEYAEPSLSDPVWSYARGYLELSQIEAEELFDPPSSKFFKDDMSLRLWRISKPRAIAALRASADAGHIIWPEATP